MDASGLDAARRELCACFLLRVPGCVFPVACFRMRVSSCVFLVACFQFLTQAFAYFLHLRVFVAAARREFNRNGGWGKS